MAEEEKDNTRRPFEILPPTPENELPAITPPTHEMRLEQAFGTDWTKASDDESRRAASTLAKEARILHAMAQLPKDHFKTETERYAAASKMVEQMTGVPDYDGKLWNGGKGFASGAEYLRNVQDAIRRGMAGGSPELMRWMAMSDEEKDAMLEREQGFVSSVTDSFAKGISGLGELVRGVPELSANEFAQFLGGVRDILIQHADGGDTEAFYNRSAEKVTAGIPAAGRVMFSLAGDFWSIVTAER